jgi:lipoyl-dependent peroxiredoxin
MKRNATALWNGGGKDGKGHLTTTSKVLNQTKYTYSSRFENDPETNPEELIAAAHAGCFSMKLSFILGDAGFKPETLETTSQVSLENGVITGSHLILKAKVAGISKEVFDKCVKDAELNCPVSKALKIKISVEATLN